MTTTFNESQHDRARDGKFTAMHHAEPAGVSLKAPPIQNLHQARQPNAVLTEPMTAYEMGLRTGGDITTFRVALNMDELRNPDGDEAVDDYLPSGCFPNGTELEPVGVVDGKFIVAAHVLNIDPWDVEDREAHDIEFERGQADRQKWLDQANITPPALELNEVLTTRDIGNLHPVPALPEGTPEGVTINGGEKDGVQRMALVHDNKVVAAFRYAPEEFDDYTEFTLEDDYNTGEPAGWAAAHKDEIRETLEAVARNRTKLYEHAEMRARWTRGLEQRVDELSLVGNPDGEEF